MNNVLPFPAPPRMAQRQGQTQQANPMRIILDRFMNGMQPEQILEQMAGPEVRQAKQIIRGKSPQQLRGIAYNMAQMRGVRLEDVAADLGVRIPE